MAAMIKNGTLCEVLYPRPPHWLPVRMINGVDLAGRIVTVRGTDDICKVCLKPYYLVEEDISPYGAICESSLKPIVPPGNPDEVPTKEPVLEKHT